MVTKPTQVSLLSRRDQLHAELMHSIMTVPPKKEHALKCEEWNRLAFLYVLVLEAFVLQVERKQLDQLRCPNVRAELTKIINQRRITVDQAADLLGEKNALEAMRRERANGVAKDEAIRA